MDSAEWKFWPIHCFKMFWLQMLAIETKKEYVELPLCEHTHTHTHTHTHSNHLQMLDVVDVLTKLCSTLCDLTDYRMPGSTVLHSLLEFTQIHWVSDGVSSSHPLSLSSAFVFNLSHVRIFSSASTLHVRWPKYWSFSISPPSEYSGWISFRIYWLLSHCCTMDSQESSLTPQFENINSLVLSLLYDPILTSIHDYWKNHSFKYMHLLGQVDASAL